MTNTITSDQIVELRIKVADKKFQDFEVDLSKVHTTWLEKCLEYGVRRFVNDSNSGLKGQNKVDAVALAVKEMQNREPMPVAVRRSNVAGADPVLALALRNAKASLTALFKKITGDTKALDYATHEKIAPFFNVGEDRAVWKDESVVAWMEKQADSGKVDYMADAKATLALAESDDLGDDLDF